MDTVEITSRGDFAQWAIERAQMIVGNEGTTFALAIREGNEDSIRSTGNQLGAAIYEALLEVFDGMAPDEEEE